MYYVFRKIKIICGQRESTFLRLIGSFAIIDDRFNRENENSHVIRPQELSAPEITEGGARKGTHGTAKKRKRENSLLESSLKETKERSRFNASNVETS